MLIIKGTELNMKNKTLEEKKKKSTENGHSRQPRRGPCGTIPALSPKGVSAGKNLGRVQNCGVPTAPTLTPAPGPAHPRGKPGAARIPPKT